MEDEAAEYHFCDSHQLNMSTLRMTSEAKVRFHNTGTVFQFYHSHTRLLFGLHDRNFGRSAPPADVLSLQRLNFVLFLQLQLKDLLCNAGFPDGA